MAQMRRYKLNVRYEITSEMIEVDAAGLPLEGAYPHTNSDRLTIEDTFLMAKPRDLTAVLAAIDTIHGEMRTLAGGNDADR